jgi:chemotaxis response regulator CheB
MPRIWGILNFRSIEVILKIERNNPDVVVMDLDLYGRIDGIETSRQIRTGFGVPVMHV